ELAASLEQGSEHPLARAVREHAEAIGVGSGPVRGFLAEPGKGVRGEISGGVYLLGSPEWTAQEGHTVDAVVVDHLRAGGSSVAALAGPSGMVGYIALADPLRPTSAGAVAQLQAGRIDVVMLTGDNAATAAQIAREAGIRTYRAGVLPQDKAAEIGRL